MQMQKVQKLGQKNKKIGQKVLLRPVDKILKVLNRGQMMLKLIETIQKIGHKVVMNPVGKIQEQRVQKLCLQNLKVGLNRQVRRVQMGHKVQKHGQHLQNRGNKVLLNPVGKIQGQKVQKLGQR